MWKDPEKILKKIPLFQGFVELGFGRAQGQTVGTSPLMCRIVSDGYPDGWFTISKNSQHKVMSELQSGFIPDWLRADCFEYHWELKNE